MSFKGTPLLFTKGQANAVLHGLINEDWSACVSYMTAQNNVVKIDLGIPIRKYELCEFYIEKSHNKYRKVSVGFSRVYRKKYFKKPTKTNEYDNFKSLVLQRFMCLCNDYKTGRHWTKDYIKMLMAP